MLHTTTECTPLFYYVADVSRSTHARECSGVNLGYMEFQKLKELIQSDPSKLIAKVKATRDYSDDSWKLIEPENHTVHDPSVYKDREVWIPRKDENGLPVEIDGEIAMRQTFEPVARISSAIQKDIVNWAVKICAGEPIEVKHAKSELDKKEQKLFDMVVKTIKDNKFEYLDSEILRQVCTYKIAAEVWYSEPCDKSFWGDLGNASSNYKMRVILMSQETGDYLYPIKDSVGKMIALGRAYKVIDDEDKEQDRFDLFTDESRTTFGSEGGQWVTLDIVENVYKKGNFIVYQQNKEEWADVQPAIERLEVSNSRLCDSNDAVGSPILAVSGKIEGFGKRGETGKVFELENGARMDVIEAAGAPESVKMEHDNLMKAVYQYTATPNISFDDAKSFGANMPGITLKLLFLPATLKAMGRQSGGWGMSVQRRLNFLVHVMPLINQDLASVKNLELTPAFKLYMPSNETENIENMVKLYSAGLISLGAAIKQLGLTDDPEAEIKIIEAADALKAKQAIAPAVA